MMIHRLKLLTFYQLPNDFFQVINTKIHHEYRNAHHDLALLEVDRPIEFAKSSIGPICLPYKKSFPDRIHKNDLQR